MPQAARPRADNDKDRSAKAQEQEFKRARGAISCAECRRLKLKCDKTVPCSSCKRRGCESICPNGSLTTGQGTRFILADTDRLHRKIAEMSDRIRHLEDALAMLQSSVTREPHPLLSRELLAVKSGLELHSAAMRKADYTSAEDPGGDEEEEQGIDAFGTLAVRDDGAATFYGRSAGSESLLLDEQPVPAPPALRPDGGGALLPPSILRLSASFPAAPGDAGHDRELIEEYLPPWPRARELCELYLEAAPWFFGAVTRRQLIEELLPLFYSEAEAARPPPPPAPAGPDAGLASSAVAFQLPIAGRSDTPRSSSHDLGLMFVILCFGALIDPQLPPAPHNTESDRYYQLTRAALNLEPVIDRPPSIATVQTLSLMGIYQGLVAGDDSIEKTWTLMGLASKLAQSLGLHRDGARFGLSPAEVQKRRALFWELFITDCWQALATGRIPSFALQFVDTELPADPDETLADDGTIQPSFPAWKAKYGRDCISHVVQVTSLPHMAKYPAVLDLDRRIRDTPLPKYALGDPPKGAGLNKTMSHFMPVNYRELTLQYIHRAGFSYAVQLYPEDPLRSPWAPSFLAIYRSACELIKNLKEQFTLFPVQIARFWVLWTHAFSATTMLSSIVSRCGVSKTSQAALAELRVAYDLFEQAVPHGGRAVKFWPMVKRSYDKAYLVFTSGWTPRTRDLFAPRDAEHAQHDELEIFSGRTRMVATKAKKGARQRSVSRRRASGHALSPADPSPSSQGTPASGSASPPSTVSETFPSIEEYGNAMHPTLVEQIRAFRGDIDQQISNASEYYHPRALMPPPPQYGQQQEPQYQAQHALQVQPQQQQSFETWYTPPNSAVDQARDAMPPPPPQAQAQPQHMYHQEYQPVSQLVPVGHPSIHLTGVEHEHHTSMYGSAHHDISPDVSYHHQPHFASSTSISPISPAEPNYGTHDAHTHAHQYQQQGMHDPQAQAHPEMWGVPPAPPAADMHGAYAGAGHSYAHAAQGHGGVHGYALGHYGTVPAPLPHALPDANFHGSAPYSMQETWMSFMQQEMPAAGAHPPSFGH